VQLVDQVFAQEARSGFSAAFDIEILHAAELADLIGSVDDRDTFGFDSARQQHPLRAASAKAREPDIEPGPIRSPCATADENSVTARTLGVDMRARWFSGDPLAGPIGQRDAAID